jgi:hypothetical protein
MATKSSFGTRCLSLAIALGLLSVGLIAASPFVNKGLVGTGEAYNYSLSVADALKQMQGGVMPPLAGQTEFAFNARIHPLRNAPYLYYLCAGLDLATFHKLPFWQIQNLSLVLSLLGAVFACYAGLRWGADCPRILAAFLSCVYVLAPPLMGAAHTFDLFMTVHVAVFVPLALAACVRGCREPSFSTDAWLAAALAAAWLAHPPVAFWLTASVITVRLINFGGNPSIGSLARGVAAAVLGFVLSGFVFVSAATLSADLGYFSDDPSVWRRFPDVILESLRGAYPGMLLPVSPGAGNLSDLQAGYVPLLLMALSLFLALKRSRGAEPGSAVRLASVGCALGALVLVVMDLPVPIVSHWAWTRVPVAALKLTTEWPMQRLYLVAVALSIFAAGTILPKQWSSLKLPRWVAPAAMLLCLAWMAYEARAFITRGLSNRWTLETTQSAFRPSNLDLTITSYAFIEPPPTYVHGVTDPLFEFRVLRNGVDEVTSPLAAGLAAAPVVQSGALLASLSSPKAKPAAPSKLKLAPGHRYLLSFAFKVPPVKAVLILKGPLFARIYELPKAGEALGFGMLDGQRRTIPVWTDSAKPEEVEMRAMITDQSAAISPMAVFAEFTLQDVDLAALPVRLESLLPLRFTVDAPEGSTVETPRRYLPGFEALVNGKPAAVLMSPYRQAMIPIPAGHSVVELSYPGPWQARVAFWTSAFFWLLFILWRLTGSRLPARRLAFVPSSISWTWRHRWAVAAGLVLVIFSARDIQKRSRRDALLRAVGSEKVDFFLSYGRKNVSEPLLATGKVGAGTVVFVHYVDATHIGVGADIWGKLFESPPIEVDYSKLQTLVVSAGSLYPKDNPVLKKLDPTELARLRSELRIELNGSVAIKQAIDTYESRPDEVLVGRTTFGSLTEPAFVGRIVSSERLPIPRVLMLPASMHAKLSVKFPSGREGSSEPLLNVTAGPNSCLLSVSYIAKGRLGLELTGNGTVKLQGAEVDYDPSRIHELELRPSVGENGNPPLTFSCTFDGKQVLGSAALMPSGNVPILMSGEMEDRVGAVETRFTGPRLTLEAVPEAGWVSPDQKWGMDVIVLAFPTNREGRHEPLLTSGVTGAGDFIYVIYQDAHHVKIGFDHWNGVAVVTDPIPVDYLVPHELWISTGALYPDKFSGSLSQELKSFDRNSLRSHVTVILDGKPVISSNTTTYPALPASVTIGTNDIGGSSADPVFSGNIYFSGRMSPNVLVR